MNPFEDWYPRPKWSTTLNSIRVQLYTNHHLNRTKADALVVLGNSMCWLGKGAAKWVRDEAGQDVEDALRLQAPLPMGGVAVAGRGLLPLKNILYVNVIDGMNFSSSQAVLDGLAAALNKAKELGAKSVMIVDVADSLVHWSIEQAAEILKQAVTANGQGLSCVKLACCGDAKSESYRSILQGT